MHLRDRLRSDAPQALYHHPSIQPAQHSERFAALYSKLGSAGRQTSESTHAFSPFPFDFPCVKFFSTTTTPGIAKHHLKRWHTYTMYQSWPQASSNPPHAQYSFLVRVPLSAIRHWLRRGWQETDHEKVRLFDLCTLDTRSMMK